VPLKRAQNSWLLAGALMVLVLVLVLALVLVLVLVLMLVLLSAWCLLWLLARSPKGNPPPSKAVVGWVSATSFGSVGHGAASAAQRWPAKAQLLLLAARPFYCSQRFEGWPGGGDQSLVGACRVPRGKALAVHAGITACRYGPSPLALHLSISPLR
jgi:hypothetical protein